MSLKNNNRRNFLKNSTLGLLGISVSPGIKTQNIKSLQDLKIKRYRVLGRTGFRVSDFGSGTPYNETVLKALLDAGVNIIDTGETYGNGNNERLIAGVIKNYDRSKIFINSKLYTPDKFESKEDVIKRTNDALERLETGYVDCMMIHSAENSRIIKDEAFHAAMKELKKEGKVRSVGVSCHGNNHLVNPEESMDKILLTAVNDGRFDVIQLAYNFFNADIAERVLKACRKKNIGTEIIKSNPVQLYMMINDSISRYREAGKEPPESTMIFYEKFKIMAEEAKAKFNPDGKMSDEELMTAAMKYVLQNDDAHTVLWAFRSIDEIEAMLPMSGLNADNKDNALLRDYSKAYGHLHCRIGCNECERACPYSLPVNFIMRYNYYYSVKGRQREAMEYYASLPGKRPHEVCGECPGFCEDACPYGVKTRSILAMAENNLMWTNNSTSFT